MNEKHSYRPVVVQLERYVQLKDGQEIKSELTVEIHAYDIDSASEVLLNLYPDWCWVS